MMRNRIRVLFMLFLLTGIISCSFFPFPFPGVTTTTLAPTMPSLVNGTITILNDDYKSYQRYECDAYDLTDINQYNDVLLETRNLIRGSNIQIESKIYETITIFPGLTQKVLKNTYFGSGVIYKEDELYYYAITNFHVIDDGGNDAVYTVKTLDDDDSTEGEVIASDQALDLAVIRFLKAGKTGIQIIDYTTRLFRRFNIGELVMAVGNPEGLENNVTFGDFQTLTNINSAEFAVIYHTATISNGSSGGALCDVEGHLLGINTWGSTDNDEQSFAIPVTIVYMFLVNNGLI